MRILPSSFQPAPEISFFGGSSLGSSCAFPWGVPSDADRLAERMHRFGIRAVKFIGTLPNDAAGRAVAHQLARSGPAVGSNYRSARRARSRAEFVSRLAVALDEADESEYWLSVSKASALTAGSELEWLVDESQQLRAILAASVATARRNQQRNERATRGRSSPRKDRNGKSADA